VTIRRLLLVDAHALIYRMHYALLRSPLRNKAGLNTSAAFGVWRFLTALLENEPFDRAAFVFDAGDSGRKSLFAGYKANRKPMPDELRESIPVIRDLVAAMGLPVLEVAGYEADDVVASLAVRANESGIEDVVIVSGDKDFGQILRPGIRLLEPGRTAGDRPACTTHENVRDRLGVEAGFVADLLGLVGDSSDEVPGAPGIGPKTAVNLIETYGSIEDMLQRTDEIKPERIGRILRDNAGIVRLSHRLVTLQLDVPVPVTPLALPEIVPDAGRLAAICSELEFRGAPAVPPSASPDEEDTAPEQMSLF
jgi:DNA polymerase I